MLRSPGLHALAVALAASLLAGCKGSGGGATAVEEVEVRGTVVIDGVPAGGITVGIPGTGTTTTAADGTFALGPVRVPYDVGLAVPSQGHALFYLGVDNATPRLPFLTGLPGPSLTGTVSGTVTGGDGYPQPADHDTVTCLDYDGSLGQPSGDAVAPGWYSAKIGWWGTPSIATKLRGIQRVVDPTSDLPIDYVAYGEVDPLTVTTAGIAQVLALDAVAATTIAGTITLPEGYAVASKDVELGCLRLAVDGTATTAFAYRTPRVGGAELAVKVKARTPGSAIPGTSGASVTALRIGLAPDATDVDLTLPAAPLLLEPEDLPSLVAPGTTFSWSERPGSIHVLTLRPFVAESWSLTAITSRATVALPDPAVVGVPFPRQMTMTWRAGSVSPRTMSEVVSTGRFAAPGDWVEAVSSTRFVQTAP
jgi:hypothetical protein